MKKIKTIKYFALLFCTVFLLQSNILGQNVLNYSLSNIEGNEILLSEIKGESLTVLDFWATWCKPCIKSIPILIELSEEYKDYGVNFIGINEDSPKNSSKIKPFSYSLGITYPVLLDSDQVLMNDLLVNSLPTLIIINNNGEIVFTHIGYTSGDKAILKETINKLLNEKK